MSEGSRRNRMGWRTGGRCCWSLLALVWAGCATGAGTATDASRRVSDAGPYDAAGDGAPDPDAGPSGGCGEGCPAGQRCVEGSCRLPPDGDGDGIESDVDCDDGDPSVGSTAQRPCSGECGDGLEQCTDGTWGECSAPTECDCTAGETRRIDCEMCGLQAQDCAGGSWESVGVCMDQGVCSPGDMELGEPCGDCGRMQRTCGDGCSWSGWTCVEIPSRCNFWTLPSGSTSWRARWLPSGEGLAPDSGAAIRGAVPLDGDAGKAWVLTDDTYHVLDVTCTPPDGCWTQSGPRDALFPEMPGEELLYAVSVPADFTGDRQGIDLFTESWDVRYWRDPATGDLSLRAQNEFTGWGSPAAPARADVRATWTDLDNLAGWAESCGGGSEYIGYVAAGGVYTWSPPNDECGFHAQTSYASFEPFALPDAPPVDRVGAAFFESGLVVLAPELTAP